VVGADVSHPHRDGRDLEALIDASCAGSGPRIVRSSATTGDAP